MKQDQKIERVFFVLLQSALSGTSGNLSPYGKLSEDDWRRINELSNKQRLKSVLFLAIEHLPEDQLPPKTTLIKWYGQTMLIKRRNDDYRGKCKALLDIYKENEIEPIILKGESCAKYYPGDDSRALGDLDLYLEDKSGSHAEGHIWAWHEGNRLAAHHGATVEIHDYKHSHIYWKGILVENHRLLTTVRGAKEKQEFEKHLQQIIPSADFEVLFLMAHMFQHFINGGFSLRQICDWALCARARHKEVNWDSYHFWINNLGISKFSNTILFIVQNYLSINLVISGGAGDVSAQLARRVLDDALYGEQEIITSKNSIKYRIKQLRLMSRNRWKYRIFMGENVLVAYYKMVVSYFFDKV